MSASRIFRDTIQFTAINQELNFFEARDSCKKLLPPGELASFDLTEFDFIIGTIDLVHSIPDDPQAFWVGLIRSEDGGGSAADFFFLDGTVNPFVTDGEFPWSPGEPNNRSGNQFCTAVARNVGDVDSNALLDLDCNGQANVPSGGAVCKQILDGNQTFAPTANPTSFPTTNPTNEPTEYPTALETLSPSQAVNSENNLDLVASGFGTPILLVSALLLLFVALLLLKKQQLRRINIIFTDFFSQRH